MADEIIPIYNWLAKNTPKYPVKNNQASTRVLKNAQAKLLISASLEQQQKNRCKHKLLGRPK